MWLDQGRLFEYRLPMPYDLKTAEKGKKFAVAKSPPPRSPPPLVGFRSRENPKPPRENAADLCAVMRVNVYARRMQNERTGR